jgi:hypothetical protein
MFNTSTQNFPSYLSGLIVEPGKKYSQTIKNSFHISMASLELKKAVPGKTYQELYDN